MLRVIACAATIATGAGLEYVGSHSRVNAFASTCNVMNYGAKGDGLTDDTKAAQSAINACTTSAGGTVLFPSPFTYVEPAFLGTQQYEDTTDHAPLISGF
jgi:polygalacturonase